MTDSSENTANYLPVFSTPQGEIETMAAYQTVLDRWPKPYTELNVQTSFGQTHVIANGSPDKPPIIFMHALFATAMSWYRNVGPLSEHFRTYAVDVLGEANPSRPRKAITTQAEMAQWFEELIDGLGVDQAYLVGNSYGAFMSAYYAMRLPERVKRLVLIGPAATFHSMLPFYIHMFIPKMATMFLPWLPGQNRLIRHSVDWMHNGLAQDPVWASLFSQVIRHGTMLIQVLPRLYSKEELEQIKCPTLLLVGEKETIYPPEAAIRSAKQLMPAIQTERIPEAHHIAALAQPEAINQRLLAFFAEQGC